jgi:Flp pilus assembly protein TadD
MRMRIVLSAIVAGLPFAALAAGSDSTEPPAPTETTQKCKDAKIWDEKTRTCIDAKSGSLSDDDRFRAVRELAWAGRPEEALVILATMTEGESDRVLTYLGFASRKAGQLEAGLGHYDHALAVNPDNILARSYLGQMLVDLGEFDAAREQLAEIRARGGAGTWAEASLDQALRTGQTLNY